MKALLAAAFAATSVALAASSGGALAADPKKAPPKKPAPAAPTDPLADLPATFAKLDADKSGMLSYVEFSKLGDLMPKATAAQYDLSKLYDLLDKDTTLSVSADEFKALDAKLLGQAALKAKKNK